MLNQSRHKSFDVFQSSLLSRFCCLCRFEHSLHGVLPWPWVSDSCIVPTRKIRREDIGLGSLGPRMNLWGDPYGLPVLHGWCMLVTMATEVNRQFALPYSVNTFYLREIAWHKSVVEMVV